MSASMPAIVLPPAPAKMSPEDFFSSLRDAPSSPRLFGPPPPPAVRRCPPHFDMHRSDGKRLRLTHASLVCFFDLTVEQACQALLTNAALIKRLRCWYGANSWPRYQLERGTHPTFTLADIRAHRNSVMKWAFDSGEEVLYDSLMRATRLLCVDSLVPLDADLLDVLDGLFSDEPASSEPVTDFPFSLPPQLMPQASTAAPPVECEPEPEPEREHQASLPEPEHQASLPPGLFPWEERDEDEDFFESLRRRGDSLNQFE